MLKRRPSSHPPRCRKYLVATAAAIFLSIGILLWPGRLLRSDNFIIYSPKDHRVVSLVSLEGADYLPVLQLFNALGKVNGWEEGSRSLVIWFGASQLELRKNDKRVRLDRERRALAQPVRIADGQWMVPIEFVSSVLPDLLHTSVEYRVGSNRMFIGDVNPVSYDLRLEPQPDGARVVVQFSGPVELQTAASNGRYIIYLGAHPVKPAQLIQRFQNPYVSEIRFDDQDGRPKLIITPANSALDFYPAQADGGRTLTATLQKPGAATPQLPPSPLTGKPAPTAAPPLPAELILPVIMLDPGHGGPDSGARSGDRVLEKDLVAILAAQIRLALLATRQYHVSLTRVGDANPSFDERAASANTIRPIAFLSLHAGNLGSKGPRVAVYSYLAPSQQAGSEPPLADTRVVFPSWDQLYERHTDRSRQLASALNEQFGKMVGVVTGPPVEAPVRVLRSIDAPAAAIEIGPQSPESNSRPLTDTRFQQQLSQAVAQAIQSFVASGPKP
jgi:N-acetylmuramoyl-L-alanine amidase